MKKYFIPKLTDIGVYKIDEAEFKHTNPKWMFSEQDCLFTEDKIIYHGSSVWRIKIDRIEFYVRIKEITEWTP